MATGVNRATIVGYLGSDPETRHTAGGAAVSNISVATTEQWRDKESGDKQERTEWHKVVFFGRLAEVVAEYLRKGSLVYVEGRIQTEKWQDRDGVDRYTTKIIARELQMLGGGGGRQSGESDGQQQTQESHTSAPPKEAPPDDFDDPIPF